MAVEGQITNFMNTHQGNPKLHNFQMGFQCSNTMHESIGVPLFYDNTVSEKNMKNSDNGLCFNLPSTMSRKRSRDTFNEFDAFNNVSFDLRSEVQQSEIDQIISHQTQRLKMELEDQMKRQAKILVSAVHGSVTKKLKEKDEEIQITVKTNWILQERVKKLFLENQLWKELAHNNEATINTLKNNLVQVIAHVSKRGLSCADDVADEAQSCCESNEEELVGYRLADGVKDKAAAHVSVCRKCGERESSVILLPCRHLCLCTFCGSTEYSCPVCNCHMTTALHVIIS